MRASKEITFLLPLTLMQRTIAHILFIIIYTTSNVVAQVDYDFFEERLEFYKSDSNKLRFNFYNLNFMKNNEYYNKISEGYTLYGNQVHPQLIYQASPNITLAGGVFLLKEYGFDGYSQVLPTFTLKIKKGPLTMLYGNIEGAASHRLVEPLYEFERVFLERMEYGSQILLETKKFWFDGWMNWEKGIHFYADHQEELTLGTSTVTTLFGAENAFKVTIPVQAYIAHKGGQIDTVPDPVFTHINMAVGLTIVWSASSKKALIQKVEGQNYFVYNKDWSFSKKWPFLEGKGIFLNYILKFKNGFAISGQYWNGYKFLSPHGGALYQSESFTNDIYIENNRKLLLMKLIHEHSLFSDIYLSTRFEPYYDLENSLLEYGYSAHVIFKRDIPINNKQ